ncbi:hypothetical protein FNCP11_06700 [Fusobacterium nucleatum]|nr:hypothetical protein FNCP11_06700 [Fusobacterium nucleatum]BEP09746.1 hypothetical protein FNSP11_05900 [Fusobacterium nucleatum]
MINQKLNLVAINGDIVNKSTVEKVEFNNGEFDRSKFTKIDSIGEIVSNGNMYMLTNNYTSIGAVTQAKDLDIHVTKNINILSQQASGEQKFGENDSQYNYYGFERNIGSSLKAENLNVTANNLNISGSAVATKTADLNVKKLNIESKVDKEDEIRKSSYKDLLKSGSKKETIHNEENSAGSLYVENKGIIRGDVNLVGSNLVLGDNSFVAGKLTTDSRELRNSYSLEEKKKGFSGGIGSGGFSIGYGKSESKLKEKDLTNAKSNLVLGDGTSLNKGVDITATNLIHGNISINNGDVKFGARKDVKDIETSSKSSGINLSVRIKSQALDRAKQGVDSFKQMKSGDILGGIASSTNTVTGLVQGLSSNITKKDGSKATLKDIKDGDFKVNNNFYANAGVNLGFNKSSSNSKSHSESGVVTTIRGKDKNSSITYNNVKNIEYIGTQAQNTKFIYNNVDNITKRAVELNNYSSSSSKSSGISTGVTIGYGDGVQTSVDAVKVSASQSKMNSNGTTYQNGRFVDVDEVHNNTKNMTLSGFNQEGGKVTGNIQNLTIESKQNTSTTKGSTIGGSLSIAPNGLPSGSASYSQTNGERRVVDSPTTFIIGDGSNLKVGKVENTAGAIGATGSGKLSIDEYVGHNLENVDKLKTVGGSVGISTSGINSIGINYNDRKQEGITKNTVIGNVEIGKSSGDEINKDLGSMTEITKDRDFKTDINIESQTINYIKNPEAFKQDLKKAKNEIEDIGNVIENTVNPPGEDKRNFFKNLRAQRWNTSFYNVTGSRMEELSRQFKAREIDEKQLKEAVRELAKGYGKDIGIDFEVVYLDEKTMPKDSEGSTGSSYILDKKNRKVLIPIDVSKIGDINELLGTITEEISHGKDALEGRQDKKVAEDKSNDEEGLESLGRPANDYVKNKLGEDNNSKIKLTTDGIDLTNADVGEKVGDVNTQNDRNSGYGETLPSQQKDPWLNKIHFKLLRLKKNTDEFSEKVLITSFYVNTKISSMLFNPKDKTIRDFTLGAFSAGAEDLSLNTYKIPEKFKYNTLSYKYGELFGHSTMSALGILGNITGSGMQGGGTVAAPATGGVSLGVAAIGAGVQTYSVGVIGTSAINSAKVGLDIKAMKSEGGSSDNNSNKSIEDTKNLEKELEELKDGWGKGSFSDKEATIEYHYKKHKEEVGADSLLQYLRKAKAFSKNLRGAKKSNVMGATKGVIKYEKNGKYIEIAPNGDIISFGTIK